MEGWMDGLILVLAWIGTMVLVYFAGVVTGTGKGIRLGQEEVAGIGGEERKVGIRTRAGRRASAQRLDGVVELLNGDMVESGRGEE